MTVKEFIGKNSLLFSYYPEIILIEFAKYHVKEALKQASKKAKIDEGWGNNDWESDDPVGFTTYEIDKDSILTAYPLDNIK